MSDSDVFKLGLVQMKCDADPNVNMDAALHYIAEAARKGVQIVCLPELFLSHYFCKVHDMSLFDLAEEIPGPRTEKLAAAAKQHNVVVVASLFEKRVTGTCMNTAVVFDADGSIAGLYRKMHIPHDPLFYEKYYFRPGDLGFKAIKTRYAKLGVLVCWDQWFPEGARITALKGAEVLIYPTAIGWHPREKEEFGVSQHDAWRTVQRGHAIANGIYVAAINRVGFEQDREGGLEFWGASFVSDPFGILVAEGSHYQEELVIQECKRSRMLDVRRNWPFFRDRRTDAYAEILQTAIE
ncbi:carbon-nitrogen hydrolase [Telmatocola sphagniphila]|uniref:Carbon-nitrogen hydrolase n=1 Tax=Telmatocola sphagniphila TaxID=1123043 RepID=A0A8E6B8X5_9BACT|nr:carbon-nitrogen hydrolase [Telmatocola sphagniphila]QVL34335.1 carbon-nitrogen hydrolase [Telmatocola sphagniphila]